jgi:hypothetical protein
MSTQLSAAQRMQLAHEQAQQQQEQQQQQQLPILTEDPFPVLVTADPFPSALPPPVAPLGPGPGPAAAEPKRQVDVSDESAFPSLGAPVSRNGGQHQHQHQWGAAALRAKQASTLSADGGNATLSSLSRASTPSQDAAAGSSTTAALNFYSTTVQLPNSAIHIAPPARTNVAGGPRNQGYFSNERREAPTTLGGVAKEVMRKHDGVQIDASSNRTLTTVILKARGPDAEARVERARTELLAWLEKKVSESVEVPKSLRALIIGSKGERHFLSLRRYYLRSLDRVEGQRFRPACVADSLLLPQAARSSRSPTRPARTSKSRATTNSSNSKSLPRPRPTRRTTTRSGRSSRSRSRVRNPPSRPRAPRSSPSCANGPPRRRLDSPTCRASCGPS